MLVNIDVESIDVAERFYCAAFELRPGRRFGAGALELLGGTSRLYLLANAAGTRACAGAHAGRSYTRHWTPVHLDIVVDDLERAVERSLSAGALQEQTIRQAVWGRIAVMSDPFGHCYCLIEFSASGYDAIAT
ncbi:VOC family protein [Luteimonas deserti]|uniref:VOC family protein n=1 Tax=Luteimonas deserti TaxID=2752306 RepID=A0A7Z0U0L7_9GAMM|nr:VOC family protein [Luteimonas deserti]NYZ63413.1 VOC family protein [Luteimonas deserti]